MGRASAAASGLYGRRWRKLRQAFLVRNPLCQMCRADGRVRAATELDHVHKHSGNPLLAYDWANLQGLCADHHRSTKARQERGGAVTGCDVQGNPKQPMKHWT